MADAAKELHSHIGASSAYRWLNCPGSVKLYGQLTQRKSTSYATIGTAAHELCEKCLLTGDDPSDYLGKTIEADGIEVFVDDQMAYAVSVYVSKIRADQEHFGGTLRVEQSFDLGWVYPGMFGRNDASLTPVKVFDTLRIYDYKNGRKPVSAVANEQCMYYAIGALGKDNPFFAETVVCTIIQPNCMSKANPVDEWEVSTDDLYAWTYDVLRPGAEATTKEDAPCRSGEWCCFCEAAGICPVRHEEAMSLLGSVSDGLPSLPAVVSLTPEEVGKAASFFTSEAFTSWVKALSAQELALLQRGVHIPGRKLVETVVKGNRKWEDSARSIEALKEYGDGIFNSALKSPAQIEALLRTMGLDKKERAAIVDPLTTRDESTKTIVVDESDRRESVTVRKAEALELFD